MFRHHAPRRPNRKTRPRTIRTSPLQAEALEPRVVLTSLLFLGGETGPTQGADGAVMSFLETMYGAENVTYKQASQANNSTDLMGIDLLILSSTPNSGDYRGEFHNSEVAILNWEEAVMDTSAGEFGLSSSQIIKSTSMTQMTISGNHPITAGLTGTIDFVTAGAETLSTGALYAGLTSVTVAANGTAAGGGSVVGNPTIFIAESGQTVDPRSGASPAQGRRVMFPMTDDTFGSLTADGLQLFENAINWAADVQSVSPEVVNSVATNVQAVSATVGGEVTASSGDVIFYWGDNDGGTDAATWDHSVNLGSRSGAFSFDLDDLLPNTTYFYRSFLSNEIGNDWADSTTSFITSSLSLPMVVISPASNVTVDSGVVAGEVTDSGGDIPEVTLFWGDNDGGVTPSNWDASVDFGKQDGVFADELTSLNPQTTYFYRVRANNAAGSVWSTSTGSFLTASVSLSNTEMYNDHVAGPVTHINATTYAGNGTTGGLLKNFETGEDTGITLTVIDSGVTYDASSAFPSDGTDAEEIFGGIIDFSASTGTSLEISGNDTYTHAYSNLDTNSVYDFAGTAIRGNPAYTNRWTLVTLVGAESATPAHSSGDGIVTAGLGDNEAAIWVGDNSQFDQGYVVQWTDIEAGADGEFQVVQRHYTSAIPTSIDASGTANGSKSYALSATRLIERFSALAVIRSNPLPGSRFITSPATATLDFNAPINAATVSADALTVDGVSATGVTVLNADTVQFSLPPLDFGEHTLSLAADSIMTSDGRSVVAYVAPFSVVTTPTVIPAADNVLATTGNLGGDVTSTGFDDPTLIVYYGTSDGGTNPASWANSATLGAVSSGVHTVNVTGLSPSTTYFYRVEASNLAGSVWSSSGSVTTATATLPIVANGAATSISAFSADVSGTVTNIGNDVPRVTLYYGETDGGTAPANWRRSLNLGFQDGLFTAAVTGLQADTTYFYRMLADNAAGSSWAPATSSFMTDEIPLLVINEIQASNSSSLTTRTRLSVNDTYGIGTDSPDWVEIYNPTPGPIDLGGFHLTDDADNLTKWAFPSGTTIGAFDYFVVFASGKNITNTNLDQQGLLHTNFELSRGGEYLALAGAEGEVVHASSFPNQRTDVTYGLDPLGLEVYFSHPTPDAPNDASSIAQGIVSDTSFSMDRGFYDAALTTDVTSATPGATIVYTTNGSEPTLANGIQVPAADTSSTPIASVPITTTTTLRAFAYKAGLLPTNVDTHTYIFVDDVLHQVNNPSGFPGSWGGAPEVDYEMDPQVVNDPNYSQSVLDGLREIPTLSVTSSIANIFGGGGIYSNTGSQIEVPASAEWILPDGSTGFQINAGFKLQGGASRNPSNAPKHSLSLRFREEYGAGELEYDLFEGPVNRFDTLQLRAMYNNSWIHWSPTQRAQGTMIRDQFFRDSLFDMGQVDAQQGTYAHLYIDGLYWGVYNVHERAEASHYAAYNGGDSAELDALNGGSPNDGNLTSYNAMKATVATRNWEAIQQVLDVDNYIDWTIMQRYAGNRDLKQDGNWRAAGGGPNNEPWRFYAWDSERTLESVNQGGPGGTADPPGLLSSLDDIEEFRIRFADRLQMHMFHGGALTPESSMARWNARVDELENAIVAESARWGDYRRDVHVRGAASLYSRDSYWIPEINRLVTDYFPQRTNIVLNQYRSANLFPSIAAPIYRIGGSAQHGGQVASGAQLSMTSTGNATVYYTLDGSDPRAEGGAAAGTVYRPGIDPPITLDTSATIRARTLSGTTWSAITQATYVIVPAAGSVVISEISYNPSDPTAAELAIDSTLTNDDFEFIEVTNAHATSDINLANMQFSSGVDFTFPAVTLVPGESAVIVEDLAAFELRYGTGINVVGQWAGGLSNSGERLLLLDGIGGTALDFEYSDNAPWSNRADGAGATLELIDVNSTPVDENNKWYHWQGSVEFGGSPGTTGSTAAGVIISEVLANTDAPAPAVDAIELHNPTAASIDISGWYLSDSAGNLLKYQIPNGFHIGAGGYVVFDETHFNADPEAPGSFALNGSAGDEVYLTIGDGQGGVAAFVDSVDFGATKNGESLGRLGNGLLVPQARETLGCGENSHPRIGTVVISELNYNPGEPSGAALAVYPDLVDDDLEYLEIHNGSTETVDLTEWRIRGGINYDFDSGTMLGAEQSLVILSFNPDNPSNAARVQAFRTHYGMNNSVTLLGGFGGQLSDSGEAIRLRSPGTPPVDDPTAIPRLLSDEVVYDDRNGWPATADGLGRSLGRVSSTSDSYQAVAWQASPPSPGTQTFSAVPGDFNGDGLIDVIDVDILWEAVNSGDNPYPFDFDSDGRVESSDATSMMMNVFEVLTGDANLDGTVNAIDLNAVGIHWQQSGCSGWLRGDFNGDDTVTAVDLNMLGINWQQSAAEALAAARVPRAPLGAAATPLVGDEVDAARTQSVETQAHNATMRIDTETHSRNHHPLPSKSRYRQQRTVDSKARRQIESAKSIGDVFDNLADQVFAAL